MDILISLAILFTFLSYLLVILNSKKSRKLLPPGPWKLPLIGNVHQLGPLPHVTLWNLAKKYGPLMHLKVGEIDTVVISSREVAKELFRTHESVFCDRAPRFSTNVISYGKLDMAFAPYGSHWREARKISALQLLGPKKVQSFRSVREAELSAMVRDISENEGSVINLGEKLLTNANSIVARTIFGKKYRDQEAFLSNLKKLMEVIDGKFIADIFPSVRILPVITGAKAKVERVHRENNRILENILQDYEKEKDKNNKAEAQNLLDALLIKSEEENGQEDPLARAKVKALILDMFTGGTETTSTTVEWAMTELLREPKYMKKAQAEVRRVYGAKGYVDESELHQLTYLNSVIKETLRLHPPAPLSFPRENVQSCIVNGHEVPARTTTFINIWAIGRDPNYWTEAETFKPERFIDNPIDFKGICFEYIPFGSGRRICPGLTFAVANMELQLAGILYHFDWKLPNGLKHEELDMTEMFTTVLKRKSQLFLIPVRYRP